VDESKTMGFFTFDDPKKMTEDGNWKYKSGETGHNYKIRMNNKDNLDYVMFILEQKYNSLG